MAEITQYPYIETILTVGPGREVELPTSIRRAINTYDAAYLENPDDFIATMHTSVHQPQRQGGAPFVLVTGSQGYSKDTVALGGIGFGREGVPQHTPERAKEWRLLSVAERQELDRRERLHTGSRDPLERAYLLDHINREVGGVVDEDGNQIPVAFRATIDRTYHPHFSLFDKGEIATGNFMPFATQLIDWALEEGFQRGILIGNSRPATVALAAAANAAKIKRGKRFEIIGVAVSNPVDATSRGVLEYVKAYKADYVPGTRPTDVRPEWADAGPAIVADLSPESDRTWEYNLQANHNLTTNLVSILGMARGARLARTVLRAADAKVPIVISYGINDSLSSQVGRVLTSHPEIVALIKDGFVKLWKVGGETPHSSSAHTPLNTALTHLMLRETLEMRQKLF
jgi:pimeloyl-ACP methyl ester carboxylesterase